MYKSTHYNLLYFCNNVYKTGTPMWLKDKKREEILSYLQIATHLSTKHYKAMNRISKVFIYRQNKYIHIQTDRTSMVLYGFKKRINLEIKPTIQFVYLILLTAVTVLTAYQCHILWQSSVAIHTYAHAHNDQYKKLYYVRNSFLSWEFNNDTHYNLLITNYTVFVM
jgi:hypothetical protein